VKLFGRLRREQGMTVIIVTHDDKVASDIGRVIRMHDGEAADGQGRAIQGR